MSSLRSSPLGCRSPLSHWRISSGGKFICSANLSTLACSRFRNARIARAENGTSGGTRIGRFTLRHKCVTPHVAQKARSSAIDGRTTRHVGYAVSQRKRKLVEEAFGWAKTIAGCAKVKVRGLARVGFHFTMAMAAYNLIRLPKLIGGAA